MADRITLEVATPSRLVIGEQVDEAVVPGIEGYFGVLPGHAAFLTTLGIGELTYRIGRDERHAAVAGGFCEVRNDKVIVLADTVELPAEIDRAPSSGCRAAPARTSTTHAPPPRSRARWCACRWSRVRSRSC